MVIIIPPDILGANVMFSINTANKIIKTGKNDRSLLGFISMSFGKSLKHRIFVFSVAQKLHNIHPMICWNKPITLKKAWSIEGKGNG